MQGNDSYLRSSVEDQIEEARRRAYSYAHSLQGVREQDASRARILEEERDRWARTFEEKSVLIEQLERELKSAVDALDMQRLQNHRVGTTNNSSTIFDDDKINSDFKKLLVSQSPNRSPQRRSGSNITAAVDMSRTSATNRSISFDPYQTHPSRTFPQIPIFSDTTAANISAIQNINTSQQQSSVDVWNHLLEQYKEQLQRTREDVVNLTRDKKDLVQRLLDVTKELTLVADERDQMKLAMQDMEGKLQFRSAQVREYEIERNNLLDVDGSKVATIERLQNEVNSLKFQLQSMERESKVSIQTIASLQEDLQKSSLDANREKYLDQLREKDQEIFRLRQQVDEKENLVKQELAETKQLVRSLQLRLSHNESLQQVSHLEQRYDRTLAPSHSFRRDNPVSGGSPTASTSSSPTRSASQTRLHELETVSSSLKRVASRDNLQASLDSTTNNPSHGLVSSPSSSILKRSASRENMATLSRSPSREKLSRSPSRTGSSLSITVDTHTTKPLTKSPSKSKITVDHSHPQHHHHHHPPPHHHQHHHDHHQIHNPQHNAASPRKSNSAVNFREEKDVHVFTTEDVSFDSHPPSQHHTASKHQHTHHAPLSPSDSDASEMRHGEEVDDDDDDDEEEEGVYEVESADDIFRSMDEDDHHRKATKKAKKDAKKDKKKEKSSSKSKKDVSSKKATHPPSSPGITVTISPKKKPVTSSLSSTAPHHHHHHAVHSSPVTRSQPSSSHAAGATSTVQLKSALKGKVLHVPGVTDTHPHPHHHTGHPHHVAAHHPATHTPLSRDAHAKEANRHHRLAPPSPATGTRSRSHSRDTATATASRSPSVSRTSTATHTPVITGGVVKTYKSSKATSPATTSSTASSSSPAAPARRPLTTAAAHTQASPARPVSSTSATLSKKPIVIPGHHHSSSAPPHVHHHPHPSTRQVHDLYITPDEDDSRSIVSLSSSSSSSTSSSSSSSSSSSHHKKQKKLKKKKVSSTSKHPVKSPKSTAATSITKKSAKATAGASVKPKVSSAVSHKKSRSVSPTDSRDRGRDRGRDHPSQTDTHARSRSQSRSQSQPAAPRSRSASAHSRVSVSSLPSSSAHSHTLPETRAYMRPTSSFVGKLAPTSPILQQASIDQQQDHHPGSSISRRSSFSPGRSPSQQQLLTTTSPPPPHHAHAQVHLHHHRSEIKDGGKKVYALAASVNKEKSGKFSALSSASSSFHLPTKSSLKKSSFVENMHLSSR